MEFLMKSLILLAFIDLAIFTIREGVRIYRRYQAKKDLEVFAEWVKKRMEERAHAQKEDSKKEG